ncbi:uncharacterized protein NPIL_137101 [Nephila pilipes]|uniref:Uncharacterized protein n=1 Tax=Nephila pilipes TaxID=299642 RepID=A0A8X6NHN0_NEPPI|nr:uncharacterized protein NPIL_137101 [Nephila pilipes]
MKFGIKTIIIGAVLVLLVVSVVIQGYVMYQISNAENFKEDNAGKVITTGVEAQTFWVTNRLLFVGPTVGNLIGKVLLGTLYVMAYRCCWEPYT